MIFLLIKLKFKISFKRGNYLIEFRWHGCNYIELLFSLTSGESGGQVRVLVDLTIANLDLRDSSWLNPHPPRGLEICSSYNFSVIKEVCKSDQFHSKE